MDRVTWAELSAVLIETNPAGPLEPDWFWILAGQGGRCVIPGEAPGGETLLERFQDLQGFDNDAFIEAMTSLENRRFLCWKRAADGQDGKAQTSPKK